MHLPAPLAAPPLLPLAAARMPELRLDSNRHPEAFQSTKADAEVWAINRAADEARVARSQSPRE